VTEAKSPDRMLAGRCECRLVRYRVPDEFLYSANCHCSNCRASTGSAFKAFAGIEREKLEVVEGAEKLFVWGDDNENHWCRSATEFYVMRLSRPKSRP
jgi:hypothetical protein